MSDLVGNPEDRFSCVAAHSEMVSQFLVNSKRLEKLRINQTIPSSQGRWLNHYST